MDREKQMTEAKARIRMLGLLGKPVQEFTRSGKLNRSENAGALYWLDEKEQKMVDDFEKKHDAVVYHVILSHTGIGDMYSMLYVSKDEDEWQEDRAELKEGETLAYVVNTSMPDCSEFGSIGFKQMFGGLVRTW